MTIRTEDENKRIVFDGNNVEAKTAFFWMKNATLNLNNAILQNNNNTNTSSDTAGVITAGGGKSIINLNSVEVLNNKSAVRGGAIYINGFLYLKDSKIENNTVISGNGGAIYGYDNSTIKITNTDISNNKASKFGGGIFIENYSKVQINNTEIYDNESGTNGGGIYIDSNSQIKIVESKLLNNLADQYGGGIYGVTDSEIAVDDVEISNNRTKSKGGAGICAYGLLIIDGEKTKISSNVAKTTGGGIIIGDTGIGIIDNGEISNNVAGYWGGGIRVPEGGRLFISNVDIKGNTALVKKGKSGGGICLDYADSLTLKSEEIINRIRDNTVGDETDNEIKQIYPKGSYAIDNTKPELVENYTATENSDGNVEVVIKVNEPIRKVEGWDISEDCKTITKIYEENIIETIKLYDLANNETNVEIEINNIDILKKAVLEVANSYYIKKQNIQYDSYRKKFGIKPEQGTKDDILYLVCSAFTYGVYKNALNIDMPRHTIDLIEYTRLYNKTYSEYFPKFYEKDKNKTLGRVIIEDAIATGLIDSNTNIEEAINENKYIDIVQNQVQVGDLLVYYIYNKGEDIGQGHVMLVESIKYNNDNTIKDVNLIHCTGKRIGANDENFDVLEATGAIKRTTVRSKLESYGKNKKSAFAIIRPLANGEKYLKSPFYGDNEVGEKGDTEEEKFNITDYAKNRLKYSGIDIQKTGSKYDNSDVGLGEEITYIIKIKNNSKKMYENILVEENISDLVTIVNSGGGIYSHNKLIWNDIFINPGETKTIYYKVKVSDDINDLEKEIKSTGNVAGIESSVVINYIRNTFSEKENTTIIDTTEKLIKNGLYGLDLINEVYKEAFKLNDFRIQTLNQTDNLTVDEIINDDGNLINNLSSIIGKNKLYGYGVGNIIKQLSFERDNDLANEVNNKMSVLKSNLKNGDILFVKENDDTYKMYIYLKGFDSNGVKTEKIIDISSNNIDEKINETEDENYFNAKGDLNITLADLAAKKKYALIRPSYLIESINIEKLPQIEYEKGEALNLADGQISVIIKGNSEENILKQDIPMEYTQIIGYNKDLVGNQKIKLEFFGKTTTFDVTVKEELKVDIDIEKVDVYEDDEISYFSTIDENMTEEELMSRITTNGDVVIEAKGPNGEIGTGSIIRITKGDKSKEYTLVIIGDLTGDSIMDDRDLLKMARYGVGLDKSLTGAYLKAGNVVKDEGYSDDVDLLKMARILVGLDKL